MTIENIKQLVKQEKDGQQKLKEAEAEAENLIANARKTASQLIDKAENPEYYDNLLKTRSKDKDDKKAQMAKETENEISQIQEASRGTSFQKAVSQIVKYVLEE
jgi:vacuolar-type H+-ATPase subunit H